MIFLINDLTFLNIENGLLCVCRLRVGSKCLCFDTQLECDGKMKNRELKSAFATKQKYNFTTICFFSDICKADELITF